MNENSNDNFDRPTAPISSGTPQFFNDAMAANMQPQTSETKKKSPLMIIIIAAGAIIAVVAAIILIISLTKNQNINNFEDNKQAGEMDTKAIFDKNAPIPAKGEGGYGYINPQNGEWVLDAKYEEAGQFYGNYASVTYSDKKAIINRKGEEKGTAKYTDEISYHIDENVWTVGTDVYNGAIEKINPDKTTSSYVGYGYAFVVPDRKDGQQINDPGYLVNVTTGETFYQCEHSGCSFGITFGADDDNKYLVVYEYGKNTKILKLDSKEEVYKTANTNFLTKLFEGIFIEKDKTTKEVKKYVTISDGKAKTSTKRPDTPEDTSISRSGKYFIKSCDEKMGIVDSDKKEIVGCEYNDVFPVSVSSYKHGLANDKELVILQNEEKTVLYDLKSAKALKEYETSNIIIYEDSAFFGIYVNKDEQKLCNMFDVGIDCATVKTKNLEVYSTYAKSGDIYYSYELKPIKNGGGNEK